MSLFLHVFLPCHSYQQRKHIGPFLLLCFITGQLPVDCLFSNIHKIGINAGLLHQLLMCTSLDNSAVCNNNNLLGIANRFQPMSNNDNSLIFC